MQKYDKTQGDQVELLRAAVLARAHDEWSEAAGRDWDEGLARIVIGRAPVRGEATVRAVALKMAEALSAYEHLRGPLILMSRKRGHGRRVKGRRGTRGKRRRHRRRPPAVAAIVDILDRHLKDVVNATEEHEGDEISLPDLLFLIGTPTPPMAPRVRVAAMGTEVWSAFGLKELPTTRLLAIASLLLGNFPDFPAETARFSVADVIQLEARGIRSSLKNIANSPDRAKLVASRAGEDVARYLAREQMLQKLASRLASRHHARDP